jgi:hypothetical protein
MSDAARNQKQTSLLTRLLDRIGRLLAYTPMH